ncbi:hypothetical protein [Terrimonas pollutisoli]|uniref:hypothetical protein n=1 Tax=Terrimonas pollutisoli TaxID=3034147 RepID=UPI0023EC49AA|nr:hypothetical protein [Terrimonas sp. H1YJ31]
MKPIIPAFLALTFSIASQTAVNAQCEKKLSLISSKTEYLDTAGAVRKTVDEVTEITISEKTITISPASDHTMTGTIRSAKCAWQIPFKEGQSEFKTEFEDQGETKNITITLEGKNGKVSFLATFDDAPDKRIRVWADSFKETK